VFKINDFRISWKIQFDLKVASFYPNDYLFTQVFLINLNHFYLSKLYFHFLDFNCFFNNIRSHPLCGIFFYGLIHSIKLMVQYYSVDL
jgi:hypothetical protein